MLDVKNLKVHYLDKNSNKKLSYDFTFKLLPHKTHLLLGANGSGKTTLFNSIMGLGSQECANIKFEGKSVGHLPTYKRPFLTVFQDQNIILHLDVKTNATLGVNKKNIDKKSLNTKLAELLEIYNLTGISKKKCHQLSGGQRQILALIRCFLLIKYKPFPIFSKRLIILDEPFVGLDKDALQKTLKLLNDELKQQTLLIATHDLMLAKKIADHTWQIDHSQTPINIKKK